jgi:hypothetical protein
MKFILLWHPALIRDRDYRLQRQAPWCHALHLSHHDVYRAVKLEHISDSFLDQCNQMRVVNRPRDENSDCHLMHLQPQRVIANHLQLPSVSFLVKQIFRPRLFCQ